MVKISSRKIVAKILDQANIFGADLAGIATVTSLKSAPSFILGPKMPDTDNGVGMRPSKSELKQGEVTWPQNAKSVLVLAVAHPKAKPEMDWWYGHKSSPGNRTLIKTANRLCDWITREFGIDTFHLPYHVEKEGIYLKDAAVMAGLGCIGKNNMLLTSQYGPRIRLRALTLDAYLQSTGPADFDPCIDCKAYCRRACPQSAFKRKTFTTGVYRLNHLPGQDGYFARPTCNIQMEKDIQDANQEMVDGFETPVKIIKYCRRCELACPIGKPSRCQNGNRWRINQPPNSYH